MRHELFPWTTPTPNCIASPASASCAEPPSPRNSSPRRRRSGCRFSLDELRYEYPEEVVPEGTHDAGSYLRELTWQGAASAGPTARRTRSASASRRARADRRAGLRVLLSHRVRRGALRPQRGILCQGRGSAANSVVCYCLFITEVDPERCPLLFERFISRSATSRRTSTWTSSTSAARRSSSTSTQVHRRRAALAATVITYRRAAPCATSARPWASTRCVDDLAKSLAWWDKQRDLERALRAGLRSGQSAMSAALLPLVQEILGFPRHLSQHVGGFVISRGPSRAGAGRERQHGRPHGDPVGQGRHRGPGPAQGRRARPWACSRRSARPGAGQRYDPAHPLPAGRAHRGPATYACCSGGHDRRVPDRVAGADDHAAAPETRAASTTW
jgi:hypothetical protein